jgi:hypothetical protein
MEIVRHDPVTFVVIAALFVGAMLALIGAPTKRPRALMWAALALGAFGAAAIAFEIWFGLTQAR